MTELKNFRKFVETMEDRFTDSEGLAEYLNNRIVGTWRINSRGFIDVKGDVNVYNSKLDSLPVKFGTVSGNFNFSSSRHTTSLVGCPDIVTGMFSCDINTKLRSLKGSPKKVGNGFDCSGCHSLVTLEGMTQKIEGLIDCSNCNKLESLKGIPRAVNGDLTIAHLPKLTHILEGPEIVHGYINAEHSDNIVTFKGSLKQIDDKISYTDAEVLSQAEWTILDDLELTNMWFKTSMTAEQFLRSKRGLIKGKKFGL